MYDKDQVHYVVVTGILIRGGKYLIAKRADWEKVFPGKWTVPGGKLNVLDYALKKKDTTQHWYEVLEDALRREVKEEVGLDIKNIGYVTSMVYVRPDGIPCLIVSLFADAPEGDVRLCNALTECEWVTLEEAREYDLIEGIYNELVMLDRFLKSGKKMEWKH
jgi:8-oxo-dGTP pyrophosphatase MutT (NUDIX family)